MPSFLDPLMLHFQSFSEPYIPVNNKTKKINMRMKKKNDSKKIPTEIRECAEHSYGSSPNVSSIVK